jgi:hypothetical protein
MKFQKRYLFNLLILGVLTDVMSIRVLNSFESAFISSSAAFACIANPISENFVFSTLWKDFAVMNSGSQ